MSSHECGKGDIREGECDVVEGDIGQCRLQHHHHHHDIDRIVHAYQHQFTQKHITNQHTHPPFKWQKSFHDHIIRNEKDFKNHYYYTVYNYLKHKLPKNWKYTSLRYPEMVVRC